MTTRWLVGGLVGLLLSGAVGEVRAIPPSSIYSCPALPSSEALRRLNLTMAWYRYMPTQGMRDGLLTAQLIGRDLFVQTRSGTVVRLDADTGRVYWRVAVGDPDKAFRALDANTRSVFVGNNNYLYALDRETGSVQWRTRLPDGLSAAPIVGELGLYLVTANGTLYAFALPVTDFLASRESRGIAGAISPLTSSTSSAREGLIGPQPSFFWSEQTGIRLEYSPLQTTNVLLCVSPTGDAVAYTKVPRTSGTGTQQGTGGTQLYRFQTELAIPVPPGQFGDVAYIGGCDSNLYALNMNTGRLVWRYTAGTPISRRPIALEDDVYVTSEKEGLSRVDRATGEGVWRVPVGRHILDSNPEADRFLAANDRFVYATDASNRLLVLDRRRGTLLSWLDTVAYRFPIPNRVTDRLYLAANDGLIVCLHDRDVETPIRHRRAEEEVGDELRKKLASPVSIPVPSKNTLRNFVADMVKTHKLKIEVVDAAFKEIGIPGVQEKEVQIPKIDNRPLSELLDQVLKQVNGTYQVVDDTLLILPGKAIPK